MNTQPIVVPVFAVEEAIKALRYVRIATPTKPSNEAVLAEQVLEQLLKDGPVPMPQGAYDALYGALKAKGIADAAMLKARGIQHQD